MDKKRRSWVEIDLEALAQNIRQIKNLLQPQTALLAVVKANGYGHGACQSAVTALENGATYLAVATLEEAQDLRTQGITAPILILGYVDPAGFEEAIADHIELTVFQYEAALQLSRQAQVLGKEALIHIKVDTGMSRIGVEPTTQAAELVLAISRLPGIQIKGIFTHFAAADQKDKRFAREQFALFQHFVDQLENRGLIIPIKHCANSAAIIEMPETHLDMVRAGIICYGLYPSQEVDRSHLQLTPVMTLKSRITHIKNLEAGRTISYGCSYQCQEPKKIATVPIGYADGYSRLLSNQAYAVVHGQKVPLTGRVCMDQCMFDVSMVNTVNIGDETCLFGKEQEGVTVDQVANWMNTINYEAVCLVSSRIPRIYPLKTKK